MNQLLKNSKFYFAAITLITFIFIGCNAPEKSTPETTVEKTDTVVANIKFYSHAWDEIINNRRVDLFNDSVFTKDVRFKMKPVDIVGIDSAKAYYNNFLVGFSDIKFTIKDIFGQGDKLVKHWNFKGKHTGLFFGIPATGKMVDVDGATIVQMSNRKIAQEQDFFDNMDMMTQLGLMPGPGKQAADAAK